MTKNRLDQLRTELDSCDRALLSAVKRRMEIVTQIASTKLAEGKPLFDRSREKVVFEKAGSLAAELGVDERLALDIMGTLVESSHAEQQRLLDNAHLEHPERQQKILIVGGKGKMGRLFARLLSERGHQIEVLDSGDEVREEHIASYDVVMLAVPMAAVVNVAKSIAPMIRADALFCDINSLKAEVCGAMAADCPGEVLGMHPMFGPTVSGLRRQKIVVCPVRGGSRAEAFLAELAALGADVIESEPQEHDKMMSIIQVLTHFHSMVMGEALRRTGVELQETLPFMSPIYRLELAVVGRLFAQNPQLYAEIEMANPDSAAMHELFVDAAQSMAKMISRRDREEFCKTFKEIQDYFDVFVDEAMTLSDAVIEMVVRKP